MDITARKQAEAELQLAHEKLRQSEERFGKAFRSSPAMMAITRLSDGRFVTVNEAFLRAIGYREDEVVGRTGKELQLHTPLEQREIFLQGVVGHGFVRDHELIIRSKSGRLITLLASGERIEIDGTPHLLSVALDITARKDAEARLRESERRLRESEARFSTAFQASPLIMSVAKPSDTRLLEVNEAFVRFVGLPRERILGRTSEELGLWVRREERERFFKLLGRGRLVRGFEALMRVQSGDVRNLQVSAELLEINGETHLLTFAVHKSVRRMAGMLEEALVLGRLEADRMTFKPSALDFRAFCQRMCDEIESATGKRCSIHLQADGIPEQAIGDESMLRHIFTNLLSNAVKYSPAGCGVDFVIERMGDDALCNIIDRGCGTPEVDQKRLFQAFHRGSNVRQIPGTGLGLLIVQRGVGLHGGVIEFRSVEGEGTTFTVKLPLFTRNPVTP